MEERTMAKLYTDEIQKIIEEAKEIALITPDEECSDIVKSMNRAFDNGVKVAVSTVQYLLARHDYEELVSHDE
jgi:hypothetical protein